MLRIELESHSRYTGDNLVKLKKTIRLLETTINSFDFEKEIINFKSTKTEGGTFHFYEFSWWGKRKILKKYSNIEIFNKIMKGHKTDGVDCFIVLNLVLEKGSGGNTVGYTSRDGSIHTYTTDFIQMETGSFAAHLFHEYTHTIGFKHSKYARKDPLRNCYSVPYALGNMVSKLTTGDAAHNCDYDSTQ